MVKPGRLRDALVNGVNDLAINPQKLLIFAERGKVVATGEPGDSWEYAYQLTVIVQDFAGDMDELTATVLRWMAVEQPDLLLNAENRRNGVRFEAS